MGIFFVAQIPAPLVNISTHVVDAKFIGGFQPHNLRPFRRIMGMPSDCADIITPAIDEALGLRPPRCRPLPLRLRRQAIAARTGIQYRHTLPCSICFLSGQLVNRGQSLLLASGVAPLHHIIPTHIHNGAILAAPITDSIQVGIAIQNSPGLHLPPLATSDLILTQLKRNNTLRRNPGIFRPSSSFHGNHRKIGPRWRTH